MKAVITAYPEVKLTKAGPMNKIDPADTTDAVYIESDPNLSGADGLVSGSYSFSGTPRLCDEFEEQDFATFQVQLGRVTKDATKALVDAKGECVIGGATCAKLAEALEKHHDAAVAHAGKLPAGEGKPFLDMYQECRDLLAEVGPKGALAFGF